MKFIIHVGKDSRGGKTAVKNLLRHVYREHGKSGDEIPSSDRVESLLSGLETGVATRNHLGDTDLLLGRFEANTTRMHRHVIISAEDIEDPVGRKRANNILGHLAKDFVAEFAPDSDWVGVVHQDRRHPHLHLVICNSGKGKALAWRPQTFRKMQRITEWSNHPEVESGKGLGKRIALKGQQTYPFSRKLKCRRLAYWMLYDAARFMKLFSAGEVSIVRQRPDTLIGFEGVAFKLSTLRMIAEMMPGFNFEKFEMCAQVFGIERNSPGISF